MKKLLIFFVTVLLWSLQVDAQSKSVWNENFDGIIPWSVTPVGSWLFDTVYYLSGASAANPRSYKGIVPNQINDSSVLETGIYDCRSYDYVYLQFSHICKIASSDVAQIEYRTDMGVGMSAWKVLPRESYKGASNYARLLRFNAISHSEWREDDDLVKPKQSWWREEVFDLTDQVSST